MYWNTLVLGAMFTQLDNDGQEFMVAYANYSNKTKAKSNLYEGKCLVVVQANSSL
jgi:hypothetical protein